MTRFLVPPTRPAVRAVWRVTPLVGAVVLALTLACNDYSPQRRKALTAKPARRLVGAWDATLWLDRAVTIAPGTGTLPRHIEGSMAFLEDNVANLSPEELSDATHIGIYDIDFRSFGFQLRGPDGVPVAVARTSTQVAHAPSPLGDRTQDSVAIVLNPGTSRFPLRLLGTFTADSITGVWTTGQLLGGGRFQLRRHRTVP